MTASQMLGELARLGLSASVAYGLFQWLGKRWVEQHFARQLEEHKRRQQELLAEYTMRVNSAFQRLCKLQDRELEVLPELWEKLCDARRKVQGTISVVQEVTEISTMSTDLLDGFLQQASFSPAQRHRLSLLSPPERQNQYMAWRYARQANDAWNTVGSLHEYIERNKLFLQADLYETVRDLGLALWDALDQHKDRRAAETDPPPPRGEEPSDFQFFMTVKETIDKATAKIEAHARKRLYYYESK